MTQQQRSPYQPPIRLDLANRYLADLAKQSLQGARPYKDRLTRAGFHWAAGALNTINADGYVSRLLAERVVHFYAPRPVPRSIAARIVDLIDGTTASRADRELAERAIYGGEVDAVTFAECA
jgi:hypothetical protein